MTNIGGSSLTSVLGLLWALLMSLSWLLPNHFPPWASFHADAWLSLVLMCAAIPLFAAGRGASVVHAAVPVVVIISIIPWVQYAVGIIPFAGQAWMSFLYVFGFALSIQMGVRWAEFGAFELPDALFLAILIASISSSGLAFGTWLGVVNAGLDSGISMGHAGARQYANLGQPNLLATLLLWGNIAGLWFYTRKKISGFTVSLILTVLSISISLTGSRQAYLGAVLSVIFIFVYKSLWGQKNVFWGAVGCLILIVLSTALLNQIYSFLFFESMQSPLVRPVAGESPRLQAWTLFLRASIERPWFGFGLTEVVGAQLSVIQYFPSMGSLFGHTHNVVLDFVIWMGFPIAILVLCGLAAWFFGVLKKIRSEADAVLFLVLIVFVVHSMLELPHQYAIFLFPVGLFVGVLSQRLKIMPFLVIEKRVFLCVYLVIALFLFVAISDYFKVERSYNKFRFEQRGLQYEGFEADKVPNVLLLTQFEGWFKSVVYGRDPTVGLPDVSLQERAVRVFPSSGAIFELAVSMAQSGQSQEAKDWLDKICKVSSAEECSSLKKVWKQNQAVNSNLSKIDWD